MRIFVRADASTKIGTGHVMRCLALAATLQRLSVSVTFVTRHIPSALEDLVQAQEHDIVRLPEAGAAHTNDCLTIPWEQDAAQTLARIDAAGGAEWMVVDHYGIDWRWEQRVRDSGCRVLVIDDLARAKHECDALLNQNLLVNAEERYRPLVPVGCSLMLGPRFALLREEFHLARQRLRRDPNRMERILVFLGGGDPDGVTLKVLGALDAVRPGALEVCVVVGPVNPHRREIEARFGACPGYRVLTHAPHMAQLMLEADLAVGAGGVSNWERCCLGLPALVLAVADNQREAGLAAAEAGACVFLGDAQGTTPEMLEGSLRLLIGNPGLRKALSDAGFALADGLGCRRVARAILRREVQVRPAREGDAAFVFDWRNSEQTWRHFHDPQPLTLQGHMQWFRRCLQDPSRVLLIGEDGGSAIGVLRYDLSDVAATVSIYLDPEMHGRGYGTQLLLAGEDWLRRNWPAVARVRAEISAGNHASQRAFEDAGFLASGVLYHKILQSSSALDELARRKR